MDIEEIIKEFEGWESELELMTKYYISPKFYKRYTAVHDAIMILKKYRWIQSEIPEEHELISKIEKALGFKLFVWQKTYITRMQFRRYGETTAKILRRLTMEGDEPIDLTRKFISPRERFEAQEISKIYEKLKAADIKTCPVFRTIEEKKEYMRNLNSKQ